MRHRVRKGKLGLKTQHRLSLLKNLATELFRHGRIITTDARAKELKRFSEKLITRFCIIHNSLGEIFYFD